MNSHFHKYTSAGGTPARTGLLSAPRLTFLPPWGISAVSVGCTGRITHFPFLPWPVAPTQSRCGLHGVACVPTDRPSPKLSSFRIKNGPARVSPADVDVDPEAKPARATRSTQAALWRLLEPRLQLGLSHLPVSKASRAQDVLKTAAGQLVGRGAALGAGEEAEERRCVVSAGWRRRLLGRWSPRPPRPPFLLSIQRGGGRGDTSTHSTSSHFLAHLHPHRSLPTLREGTAPQLYR